jgi:tetratricopeptide (TPR) repeat protein
MRGSSSGPAANPVLCEEQGGESSPIYNCRTGDGFILGAALMFPRARSAMNGTWKLLAVALATVALFSLDFHAQSTAAAELNLGVEAFKQSAYAEAIQHLEKAVSLDPENQNAHMYLANAYAKQFQPGVDTPENCRLADQAIEQYRHVLDSDSNRTARIDSAKGIAKLYLQMNKFDDSKKFYQMASDFDPKDPEPYFAIGRIDSIECHYNDREGLLPGEPRPTPSDKKDQNKACYELKARNAAPIEEGIDSLNKGLKLSPADQLAMENMAELYLEKANIECDDSAANEEDRKMAGAWFKKKWFGIPVRTTKSTEPSSFLAFQSQLHGACQLLLESSGSGEPYDVAEAYEVYSAIIPIQDCPEDDCGSPPNALGGKGLDVIVVFFDLKSDRSKRAA